MLTDFLRKLVLLCIVAAGAPSSSNGYDVTHDYTKKYGRDFSADQDHRSSNDQGFVEPLDFSGFSATQNFQSGLGGSGFDGHPSLFAAETKPVGFTSIFNDGQGKKNGTGFVEPVHFATSFGRPESEVLFRPRSHTAKPVNKEKQATSETTKLKSKPGNPYFTRTPGKSSYPGARGENEERNLYPRRSDVEVFLPPGKTLLPTVHGKPKPYDGYRAAPRGEGEDDYNLFQQTTENKRKRKTQKTNFHVPSLGDDNGGFTEANGKVTYKNKTPKKYQRVKKQPAEYVGGIYPYYDFSDPKNAKNLKTAQTNSPRFKEKEYRPQTDQNIARIKSNYRKSQEPEQETTKRKHKKVVGDSERQATEEEGAEEEEQFQEDVEEMKGYEQEPVYVEKLNLNIPKLRVKTYPFEEYKNQDEYEPPEPITQEEFSSSKSDIEKLFGVPDFSKELAQQSQRQEQLRKNKHCVQLTKKVTPSEISTGRAKRDAQLCYLCTDPKTGGSFEQCSYQTDPKSNQYFVGSSTSFSSKKPPKSVSYRYKRDLSSYDPFENLHDYSFTYDDFVNLDSRLRKTRKSPKYNHNYYHPRDSHYRDLHSKSSSTKPRKSKYYDPVTTGTENVDSPPKSYNGPEETYEGPTETYEGPEDPYEGPDEPYEGPKFSHGELVDGKYYDARETSASDHYDKLLKNAQIYAGKAKENPRQKPANYRSTYKPKVKHELEDEFGPQYQTSDSLSELAGYRFGPEHFKIDEEEEKEKVEVEKERDREELVEESKKVDSKGKSTQDGPQTFPKQEETSSSEKKEKKSGKNIVKFKNGDVCEKIKKENMICMTCVNDKTGASYEQCQYATKPGNKYYSYGTQKSYKQAPPATNKTTKQLDQEPEKSDVIEKKVFISKKKEKAERKIFDDDDAPEPEELLLAESRSFASYTDDLLGAYSETVDETVAPPESPEENKEPTENTEVKQLTVERIEPRDGVEGLDDFLRAKSPYEEREGEEEDLDEEEKAKKKEPVQEGSEDQKSFKSYEDYFHNLFPEFAKEGKLTPYSDEEIDNKSVEKFSDADEENAEETENREEEEGLEDEGPSRYYDEAANEEPDEQRRLKDKEKTVPDFIYDNDEHKKDLEKALGDFVRKDWTNCKKIIKEKLTCYQCVDKNGVDNEECMYVEASAPVHKHLAYHEKKDFGKKPKKERRSKDLTEEEEIELERRKTSETEGIKIRSPKNARPDHIPVTERSEETINNEKYLPRDLVSTATGIKQEETSENVTERRPRMRKSKKNKKQKRIKTNRAEETVTTTTTTTTTTEVPSATTQTTEEYVVPTTIRPRKIRKYPVKKFSTTENLNETENSTVEPNLEKPQTEEKETDSR